MKIVGIALGSTLFAIGLAQPTLAQQDQNRNESSTQDQSQSGPEGNAQSDRRTDDDGAFRSGRMRSWHMNPMWHHRFSDERGAHFRLRQGQMLIDVQCPANDSLQSCVNAVSQLLDKARTMPGSTNSSPGGGLAPINPPSAPPQNR
jgi:hypothetical protein